MHYKKSSYLLAIGVFLFLAGGCGVGRQSALSRKLFVKTGNKVKEDSYSTQSNQKERQQKLSNATYIAYNEKTAEDGVLLLNQAENSASTEQSIPKTTKNEKLVEEELIAVSSVHEQNTDKQTKEEKSKEKQTKAFSILGIILVLLSIASMIFGALFYYMGGFLLIFGLIVPLIFSITGLLLSVIALKNSIQNPKLKKSYKALSITGLVLNSILTLGLLIILLLFVANV